VIRKLSIISAVLGCSIVLATVVGVVGVVVFRQVDHIATCDRVLREYEVGVKSTVREVAIRAERRYGEQKVLYGCI
jgi:hypothetical protein